MRYNDLITEASFGNRVVTNVDTIKRYMEENNISPDIKLFRGFRGISPNTEDVYYSKNPSNRRSANTTNYFTSIVDGYLPEWKPYPNRSDSFICSTGDSYASSFGTICKIIPADPNALLGVCPSPDIWDSFRVQIPALNSFIIQMYNVSRKEDTIPVKEVSSDNINKIISTIDHNVKGWIEDNVHYLLYRDVIDSIILQTTYSGDINIFDIVKKYGSFANFLSEILHPDTNGFELVKYDEKLNTFDNNEVWFATPAYIIPINTQAHHEIFRTNK